MADILLTEIDENYPDELITRAEYALRRNVAGRTIGKYVQSGVIPLWDNKIWPEEADARLEIFLVDPLGSGRHNPDTVTDEGTSQRKDKINNISYTEARTEEKKLKIELLELDVALKKGQMVLTEDVENAAFSAARELRDRMLNIPDRVAAIVAAETDEVKVRDYITEQIEAELNAVTREMGEIPDEYGA
ncbi:MAG: hypothetical protein V3U75_11735 [Methylococcaceae bacterium]